MTYGAGTKSSAVAQMGGGPRKPAPAVFPVELLQVLAVREFVQLAPSERAAWAAARGINRVISPQLMKAVIKCEQHRADNARLGLPDPIRSPKKGGR